MDVKINAVVDGHKVKIVLTSDDSKLFDSLKGAICRLMCAQAERLTEYTVDE